MNRLIHFVGQCVVVTTLLVALIVAPLLTAPAHAAGAPQQFPEATAQSRQLWDSVKNTYANIQYIDLVKHSNPRLRFTEQMQVRAELQAEGNPAPTQEQIQERHTQWYAERLNLSNAYTQTRDQLDTLMPALIAATQQQNGTVTPDALRNNAKSLLLGLTYMRHYYGFSIGGTPVYEHMLADPNALPAIDRLNALGNRGYLALTGSKTADTYARYISRTTGFPTITAYLRQLLNNFAPGTDPNQWVKDTTRAIVEENSTVGLFDKYDRFDSIRDQLLPLLALSGPHIYVGNVEHTLQYGLTSTYGGPTQKLRNDLAATLREQSAFWEFWKRMSTTMNRVTEPGHVLILDSMKRGPETGRLHSDRWSPRQGQGADPGVLEFFSPIEKYRTFFRSSAVAEGFDVRFYMEDAIGQPGTNTYTHELTHIYDELIWFNGAGTRAGVGGEIYARGLFEAENNTQPQFGGHTQFGPYFNLNTAYELGENRIQNASPTRFQQPSDVGEYMQGVMDVLYSLDAMEAASALKLPNDLKQHAFNKVSLTNDPARPNTALDTFTSVSQGDVATLTNINDIIDADLVSGRMVPKGVAPTQTVPYNEYVVVPLYEPVYAGMQNDNGVVGSFLFRRHAHELLAEYGWDKGFVGYMSNRYPNDAAALADIAAAHGGTMKSFKKAMFERRINRFDEMRPAAEFANAREMQAAMDAAVAQDIAALAQNKAQMGTGPAANVTRNVTAVRELKDRIFRSYIASTNDFRTSIYKEKRESTVTHDLNATVTLTNEGQPRPFTDNEFRFTVTGADEKSTPVKGLPTAPVPARADGTIPLGTLQFTEAGTYTYTIAQVAGNNTKITYDTQTAQAAITVEWASESTDPKAKAEMAAAGKDILRIKNVELTKNNQPTTAVQFANIYTPERTQTEKIEEIPIPVEDEIILNNEISAWEPDKILSPGQAGVLTKRTVTTFVDGVQEGTPTVTETITTPMEKRRIERGTKALTIQPAPKPRREGTASHALTGLVTLTTGQTPRPFNAGDFTINVRRATATSDTTVTGLPTTPVSVPANGQTNLAVITISDAGTHTLIVEQERGNNPKITYDTTPVTVTITTEWQPGAPSGNRTPDQLVVTNVTYTKGNETPAGITFNNTYTPAEGTETETSTEKIAITETTEYDPNVLVTAEPTIREGQEGVVTITRTWRTLDGERVGEPTEKRETTTQMRPRVIVKGTKALPLQPSQPIVRVGQVEQALALKVALTTADGHARPFTDQEFTVTLERAQGTDENKITGLPTEAIRVPAHGNVELGTVTIHDAGTYTLNAMMVQGTNPKITYDPKPIIITIVTEWQPKMKPGTGMRNASGDSLVVTNVTYTRTNNDGQPQELAENERVLTNIYTPTQGTSEEISTEKIAITETVEIDPNTLVTAEPTVRDEGQEGVVTITRTWRTLDGERVGEPTEKRETTTQMRPRVIVKGSKALPLTPATPIVPEEVSHTLSMLFALQADGKTYDYKDNDLTVTIAPAPGTDIASVKGLNAEPIAVPANGHTELARLTFTKPGTYEFIVTQNPSGNPQIQVDTTPVTIRIVVDQTTINDKATLEVATTTYHQGDTELPTAEVANTYLPVRGTEITKREIPIKIEDKIVLDPNVLVTEPDRIESEGVEGLKVITTTQKTIDGEPDGEAEVTEEILVEMQPRIIVRGTRALALSPAPLPTPNGNDLTPGERPAPAPAPTVKEVIPAPQKPGLATTGSSATLMLISALGALLAGAVTLRGRRK